jgi:tetratricopeptide (TPR) repeat protein/predicted MPP superfamily phosphohydrolase
VRKINKDKLKRMWNHKGYLLAKEGNYEESIKYFDKALEINMNDKIALLNKANALSKLRRDIKALEHIEKILTMDPEDLDALTTKVIILRDLGNPEKGLEVINQVLMKIPNDITALANKVMLLNELGKIEEVVDLSKEILDRQPNHIETLTNLGAAYSDLKEFDKAMDFYKQALKINPFDVPTLVNKGILLSRMGKSEDAIKNYDLALKIEPKNPIILGNKGNDLEILGETEKAMETFVEALEIDPENDFLLLNKSAILNNNEKYSEGLEFLLKLKSLHPNYPHTYSHLGILYLNLNNFQEALDNLKKGKKLLGDGGKDDERITEVSKFIGIAEKLNEFGTQMKLIDEKFINLIDTENLYELRNYIPLFYQNIELIINECKNIETSDNFLELLIAKKDTIEILNLILNDSEIPVGKMEIIRNIFKKFNLNDFTYVLNIIENLSIEIERYGNWEDFLSEKKIKIQAQFHNLSILDGTLTHNIFEKLEYKQSIKQENVKSSMTNKIDFQSKQSEVNILHLSDLHFGIENTKPTNKGELVKRNVTIKKLLYNLKQISEKNKNWTPDIIVISGDLGYAGKKEDYNLAKKWILELLAILDLEKEDLIVCPGNHDRYIKDVIDNPRYPENIVESDDRWYSDNNEPTEQRFSEFINFCKDLSLKLYSNDEITYLSGYKDIKSIRFVVLNSARYAWGGNGDQGHLFLGWPDILKLDSSNKLVDPKKYNESMVTISVFHHPDNWFNNNVRYGFKDHGAPYEFLSKRCHIILSGHVHAPQIGSPIRFGKYARHFTIGAVYLRQEHANNCAILKINYHKRTLSQLPINYIPSENKWMPMFENVVSFNLNSENNVKEVMKNESLLKNNSKSDLERTPKTIRTIPNSNREIRKILGHLLANYTIQYYSEVIKNEKKSITTRKVSNLINKLIEMGDFKARSFIGDKSGIRHNAIIRHFFNININEFKEKLKKKERVNKDTRRSLIVLAADLGLLFYNSYEELNSMRQNFVRDIRGKFAVSIGKYDYVRESYVQKRFIKSLQILKDFDLILLQGPQFEGDQSETTWKIIDPYRLRDFIEKNSINYILDNIGFNNQLVD